MKHAFLPLAFILSVIFVTGRLTAGEQDDFDEEFQFISGMQLNEVGRSSKIAAWEQFIEEHSSSPRVAKAMIELGALWQLEDPEISAVSEPAKADHWFNKAAESAEIGSEDWNIAKWILVELYWNDQPEIARIHLSDIETHADGHSLTLAKCELQRFNWDLKEGRIEAAEERMRRLAAWYADRTKVPADTDEKFRLDHITREPICQMMGWYATAPMSVEERQLKIKQAGLLDPDDHVVFEAAQRALKEAETNPVFRKPSEQQAEPPPEKGNQLLTIIILNVVAVSLLSAILLWKRRTTMNAG